jgi:uncharacterized Zn-finger protein
MENTFDSKKENIDAIVCPYCEHVHANYDEYIEVGDMAGEFEMDCVKCGNNFKVDFYSLFYFQTKK